MLEMVYFWPSQINMLGLPFQRLLNMARTQRGGKRLGAGRSTIHPEGGVTIPVAAKVPSHFLLNGTSRAHELYFRAPCPN